jgi:hypothetical protein
MPVRTSRTGALDEGALRVIQESREPGAPRVVLSNAAVRSIDPAVGDLNDADLLLDGAVLVDVGPGLRAATPDAVVVDCSGLAVLPVAGGASVARLGTLTPGGAATFAVVPARVGGRRPLEQVVWYGDQAAAVVVDGTVVRWGGRSTTAASHVGPTSAGGAPHLGSWIDERADVVQVLTADGRYDETRGGRPHAYQGSYWLAGDHVVYRDDLGFWAYGVFRDGTLHHAGFRFHR